MKQIHWLLTSSLALQLGMAGTARAEIRCGSLPVRWNAPEGAAVVTRTEGVVSAVFDSAGKHWTHVMLSHGDQDVSQADRSDPGRADMLSVIFDAPLDPASLRAGLPGVSRLNTAGAFTRQWGYQGARVYPGGPLAVEVLRFLDGLERVPQFTSSGAALGFSRYLIPGADGSTSLQPYSFLQFKEIGTNHLGTASPDGFACSTFVAWATNRALGDTIPSETFDRDTVLRGLTAARNAGRDACRLTLVGEEHDRDRDLDICGRAGSQIANCLSGVDDYSCGLRGDEWRDDSRWFNGTEAHTLSPDRLVNFAEEADITSPWNPLDAAASAQPHTLEWSDDGAMIHGCWADGGEGILEDLPEAALDLPGCETMENVMLALPTIRAYHDGVHGDAEMDGNHPRIDATVRLEPRSTTLDAVVTLTITEGGGDGTLFKSTDSLSGVVGTVLPLLAVPAGCVIESVESSADSVSGALSVADAGESNHSETLYARPNTSDLINTARCVSDNDGGVFGRPEENLYCDFSLLPVTIHLRNL